MPKSWINSVVRERKTKLKLKHPVQPRSPSTPQTQLNPNNQPHVVHQQRIPIDHSKHQWWCECFFAKQSFFFPIHHHDPHPRFPIGHTGERGTATLDLTSVAQVRLQIGEQCSTWPCHCCSSVRIRRGEPHRQIVQPPTENESFCGTGIHTRT